MPNCTLRRVRLLAWTTLRVTLGKMMLLLSRTMISYTGQVLKLLFVSYSSSMTLYFLDLFQYLNIY